MAQLRHPNVLLFMGACTDPGNMAIVTELLTGGNGEQVPPKKRKRKKKKDVLTKLFFVFQGSSRSFFGSFGFSPCLHGPRRRPGHVVAPRIQAPDYSQRPRKKRRKQMFFFSCFFNPPPPSLFFRNRPTCWLTKTCT